MSDIVAQPLPTALEVPVSGSPEWLAADGGTDVRSDWLRKARVQDWLDRLGVWPRLGGGCHCSRDTVAAIETAGFHVERVRAFDLAHRPRTLSERAS